MADLRFGYDGDGGLGDRLVQAVLDGRKTATSSLAVEYLTGEPLPRVGEQLRLVDGQGRDRGTVETTGVAIVPVDQVGEDVARAEGFADAAQWRTAHTRFWAEVAHLVRAGSGDPGWALRPGEPVVVHRFRLVAAESDRGPSVQEQLYPTLTCFGCGPANASGLQLRSYVDAGGEVVAAFSPWPQHDNGLGYLNGGIISTLLDCHSAAVALSEADRRGWRAIGGAALPYVTTGLDVRYLRPSPLREPAQLRGQVVTAAEDEIVARVELWWQDKPRAEATARWRRWRPRPRP